MGKFSKALNKADNDSDQGPVKKSPIKPMRPKKRKIPPRTLDESLAPIDNGRPENTQDPTHGAVEHPQVLDSPAPLSAKVPEPAPPSVDPQARQPADNLSVDTSSQASPLESKAASRLPADRKPEGENISLIKPSKQAPSPPAHQPRPEETGDTVAHQPRQSDTQSSGKAVQVKYSKTKVQVNDPEVLRNNRIFSVFDDIETTDQIKILRTQVLRKLKAIDGNSILITSGNPYEGKTFTSINLGVSIAKEFDRTVLIIDADMRKPTQKHTSFSTEFFSLSVEAGLTDYLEGNVDISDILINPGIDKLTLIPAGQPVNNSPELLNSGRMEEMIFEIKSRYPADRVVIVDGPAILPFPDAMILARYVDGVVPVIEAERTSDQDLKKMMLRLKEANILGTVLNKKK